MCPSCGCGFYTIFSTCMHIYEFSLFHKVAGLFRKKRERRPLEEEADMVYSDCLMERPVPWACTTAKPYLFILHIMIGNPRIFGNRDTFYIFKKNPYNGWLWRKCILLRGYAFKWPEGSFSGHMSSLLYLMMKKQNMAKISSIQVWLHPLMGCPSP